VKVAESTSTVTNLLVHPNIGVDKTTILFRGGIFEGFNCHGQTCMQSYHYIPAHMPIIWDP
jgi:hypothetical protein